MLSKYFVKATPQSHVEIHVKFWFHISKDVIKGTSVNQASCQSSSFLDRRWHEKENQTEPQQNNTESQKTEK